MNRLWAPGSATGIGSLPGDDPAEAVRLVVGELPDLPHLPELPARGPGADMIGRGACLLSELPVEIQPSGWRLTARPGRDLRRAQDFLARDLDALEQYAGAHIGALKVQLVGPWTLAANLELPSGHRVLSDHGATRDLAESLADGLTAHLGELKRRLPGASLVVQLDEPSLPDVLAARVPTPSGWGTIRSVEASTVVQTLASVLDVIEPGARVVHCCASDVPVALLRRAGVDAISFDLAAGTVALDAIGEAIDAGVSIWAGVLPSTDSPITLDTGRDPIRKLWDELGFARSELAETVVPTPACGLAGASPAYVRRALSLLRDVGRSLFEDESW